MRLLIDGYNLLHASDLFGSGDLAGTLRGSREALLNFLAHRLSERERAATVIVFDAADAPPGLPNQFTHEGIDVRFAREFEDADAMIESLLAGRHRARGLTVVSGDRRVQRAARSCGAQWVDSAAWLAGLRGRAAPTDGPRPSAHDPAGRATDWVAEFSDPAALAEIERQAAEAPCPAPRVATVPPPEGFPRANHEAPPIAPPKRAGRRRPPLARSGDKPTRGFGAGVFDPFPPGYADDLLPPDGDPPDRAPRRE